MQSVLLFSTVLAIIVALSSAVEVKLLNNKKQFKLDTSAFDPVQAQAQLQSVAQLEGRATTQWVNLVDGYTSTSLSGTPTGYYSVVLNTCFPTTAATTYGNYGRLTIYKASKTVTYVVGSVYTASDCSGTAAYSTPAAYIGWNDNGDGTYTYVTSGELQSPRVSGRLLTYYALQSQCTSMTTPMGYELIPNNCYYEDSVYKSWTCNSDATISLYYHADSTCASTGTYYGVFSEVTPCTASGVQTIWVANGYITYGCYSAPKKGKGVQQLRRA